MLALANQTADRIRHDAKLLADQDVATSRRILREEIVAAAIREASDLVRGAAQPQDQERFVREFIGTAGAAS